jgi:glycosyl hydrolase family 43
VPSGTQGAADDAIRGMVAVGTTRGKSAAKGGKGGESRSNLLVVIAILVGIAIWVAVSADPWQSFSHDGFWQMDRSLADPSGIYAGQEYSVFTTTAKECVPGRCTNYWVPRYTSPSLSATAGLRGDAMPALPGWVDPHQRQIWAPSVVKIGHGYVMYFSATARRGVNTGKKCIGTAVSRRIAGPFLPQSRGLVCGPPGYWALDPYAVSDGVHWYLLWREDDASHLRGKIVGAQLTSDGLSFGGAGKRTLVVGEFPWEDGSQKGAHHGGGPGRQLPPDATRGRSGLGPIENPAMARHPETGEWLLTWSANRWDTQDYATGLATCRKPLGPCERVSRDRPWLHRNDDSSIQTSAKFGGAGGLSFIMGPDRHLYAIFHAYRGTNTNRESDRIGWAYRVEPHDGGYQLVEF